MQELSGCVRSSITHSLVSLLCGAQVFTHQLSEEEAKDWRIPMT